MAERRAAIFGTEKDQQNCPFYLKIGACRHGDRCSRLHNKPVLSQTILLPNLYQSPISKKAIEAAGGQAPNLSDAELQQHFDEFYEDIFEGLAKYGQVDLLNVCANLGDHLVGNVYVKYQKEDDANESIKGLKGRFYDGRPIISEFSPVTDFTEARCRQYDIGTCNRGGFCNFMHLHNPSKSLYYKLFGDRKSRSPSPKRDYRDRDRDYGRRGGGYDRDYRGGGDRDRDRDRDYGRRGGGGYDRDYRGGDRERDRDYGRYDRDYRDRDRDGYGRSREYDRDRDRRPYEDYRGSRNSKSPEYSRSTGGDLPPSDHHFNRPLPPDYAYPPPTGGIVNGSPSSLNNPPQHPHLPPTTDEYSQHILPIPTTHSPLSAGSNGNSQQQQQQQPSLLPSENGGNVPTTASIGEKRVREDESLSSEKRLKGEEHSQSDENGSIQWASNDERRTDEYDVKTSLKTSISESKE
ncbi:hypothetical protein RB653_000848 [Dictyostelium firmibasis]|uniref:Uncharacterized protein n=1 Tax=Dictyostelium firmibasis TaxID=79012 RepID=A0AAN7TVW6_9MYCE